MKKKHSFIVTMIDIKTQTSSGALPRNATNQSNGTHAAANARQHFRTFIGIRIEPSFLNILSNYFCSNFQIPALEKLSFSAPNNAKHSACYVNFRMAAIAASHQIQQ